MFVVVAACGLAVGLVGWLVVGVAVSVGAGGGGAGWFVAVCVGGVLGGSAGAGAGWAVLWLLTGVVVVGCPLGFRAGFFFVRLRPKKEVQENFDRQTDRRAEKKIPMLPKF